MSCNLTNEQRETEGMRCRSFTCIPCRDFNKLYDHIIETKIKPPKRWTWEEILSQVTDIDMPSVFDIDDIDDAFHANEPYISHIEAENQRLKTKNRILTEREVVYRNHMQDISIIKSHLEARIKELEK